MENKQEKSQEEMVKEAVEEAKAKAQEAEEAKADAAGEAAEKEENVSKELPARWLSLITSASVQRRRNPRCTR